jgi:hypothetical protein
LGEALDFLFFTGYTLAVWMKKIKPGKKGGHGKGLVFWKHFVSWFG